MTQHPNSNPEDQPIDPAKERGIEDYKKWQKKLCDEITEKYRKQKEAKLEKLLKKKNQ